jgi:hypothetical protein
VDVGIPFKWEEGTREIMEEVSNNGAGDIIYWGYLSRYTTTHANVALTDAHQP